jgi:hypothetical protein
MMPEPFFRIVVGGHLFSRDKGPAMRYLPLLLALLFTPACRNPRTASNPVPAPAAAADAEPDTTPRLVLNPGARVRARLQDGSELTGTVLVRYAWNDERLVVCEDQRTCAGPDAPEALTLVVAGLKSLAVRGRMSGVGVYGGAMMGAGIGAYLGGEDDGGLLMGVGMMAGGFGGAWLGKRTTGWVSIFPCFHGCADGEYPDR